MSDVGHDITERFPIPPAETVRAHLIRSRELVLDLHRELTAAAAASLNTGQALRLSALARGCESLALALVAIARRTQ